MMRLKTKYLFFAFMAIGTFIPGNSLFAQVKIGVFADCQYCNCNASGTRFYRNSLDKLNDCIDEFNSTDDIDFIVGLGDLIDNDFSSYKTVNSILEKAHKTVYNVIGNHDYSVEPQYYNDVPKQLGLIHTYYTVEKEGWKFIFLNGNEITFQSTDKRVLRKADKMVAKLTASKKPNNQKWNGGMSKKQVRWLKNELKSSEKEYLKVVLFCHFPIVLNEMHSLWNNEEILKLINKFDCVKAWINGHDHSGGYIQQNGIHFITMKGMVETESENSFSIISFSEENIKIDAFGRGVDRNLPVR